MTELLTVEALFEVCMGDSARPGRKESFVDLMEPQFSGFVEYEVVEKLGSEAVMCEELCRAESDVESTASSRKEDLEVPKTLRKRRSREKHAVVPKHSEPILLPQPPKQIGLISIEERQAKIQRFLAKRARRCWNRRISYDCRKRVADSRLRVKGRFVSKAQLLQEKAEVREEQCEEVDSEEGWDVLRQE